MTPDTDLYVTRFAQLQRAWDRAVWYAVVTLRCALLLLVWLGIVGAVGVVVAALVLGISAPRGAI